MNNMISKEDIDNRFTYHKPSGTKNDIYENLRAHGKYLAMLILENVPEGREQSTAITKLEEVIFWANAGIARKD